MSRTIRDVDENKFNGIFDFVYLLAKAIDPSIEPDTLGGRLALVQVFNEKDYIYYLDRKYPLMTINIDLLIDGT